MEIDMAFKPNIAMVMSGGGAKGAFQVGVMERLILERAVPVTIFGGVSTGAIQALGGAQNDIAAMKNVWTSIRTHKDVYTKRFLGLGGALFGADSQFDNKPLRQTLRSFGNAAKLQATGHKLVVGVVSLRSGQFEEKHETDPDIVDWVIASTAVPVAFPTLERPNTVSGLADKYVDGGVRDITPLSSVLKLNPSVVIVVLASPRSSSPAITKMPDNLLDIGFRAADILTQEVMAGDLEQAEWINALLAARQHAENQMITAGLDGPTQKAILGPLDTQISRFKAVPILVIAPPKIFSGHLEFDPAKIAEAIAAGRAAVDSNWSRIEPMVTRQTLPIV
jgi:NTE family protein